MTVQSAGTSIIGVLEVVESDFSTDFSKNLGELSPAEKEADAAYLKLTQQNKVSMEQDVKCKAARSFGSKEGACELAGERNCVSAGCSTLPSRIPSVSKAMTFDENPKIRAAERPALVGLVHPESESHSLSSRAQPRHAALSIRIDRRGVSLIPDVHSGACVVLSRVIMAHMMWTRKRLESQVIVTSSHRVEPFSRQLCVLQQNPSWFGLCPLHSRQYFRS